MNQGSCLCGAVRFEINAPYQWMANCHCSMCRKHHGTLFGTTIGVARANFRWLQGEGDVVHYKSSAAFSRPFCKHCGSTMPDEAGDVVICAAGTIDGDVGMKPGAHIFVASKSPMCEITDELRQFDEYPPGFGSPVPAPAHMQARSSAAIQGSCLCGDVTFEIDEAPQRLVNCHCSRCRKSRGTAYGTNFFTRTEKLRWTKGDDKVRSFKLPEATVYATGFCSTCGSLLPAPFPNINRYLVPVGSVDSVLSIKPGVNIFVGSKASWHDITDSAQQFEEFPPRERVRELMF